MTNPTTILQNGRLSFWCLGCDMPHAIPVSTEKKVASNWLWNGSLEAAVTSPSILVSWDVTTKEYREAFRTFREKNGRDPSEQELPVQRIRNICHSFIGMSGAAPGHIVYLNDCTHGYAGKTIPLPPIPTEWL